MNEFTIEEMLGLKKDWKIGSEETYKLEEEQEKEGFLNINSNEHPKKFTLPINNYLKHKVDIYYHQDYTGYKKPGNPDFINTLKNTFESESHQKLRNAQKQVIDILKKDIPNIMRYRNETNYLCMCVPRAKALKQYSKWQLMFSEAVSRVAQNTEGLVDGTRYIVRHTNTRTTHLKNMSAKENDGRLPYPGITKDTCTINRKKIEGKKIILIDDVYTKTINVGEDCIQALFDNGAKSVIFYAIGRTI